MSEVEYRMLAEYFERLDLECDTREKAIAQLQSEGLLDENGQIPAKYRDPAEEAVCQ
jgi:hypothetical protein